MNLISCILSALTGYGLLLFSLRFLTHSLDTHLSRKLKSLLASLTNNPWRAFTLGWLSTFIVQASSVTIISTMSLMNKNLFSLDRAIMVMLGAGIGSALKTLFIFKAGKYLSAILIFVSATSYLTLTSFWKKKLSEATLAIGISILGMTLMESALTPLAENEFFKTLLVSLSNSSIGGAFLGWLIGAALAIGAQSSSSITLFVLSLAAAEKLNFPAGVSIILGANVGTTSTAILASIGQSVNSKKLALAHLITRGLGSLWVLLFFNTHILIFDHLLSQFTLQLVSQLAIFHIAFNMLNGFTWAIFLPILTRTLQLLYTEKGPIVSVPFPETIKMLFTSIPERAADDIKSALRENIRALHWCYEGLFIVLYESNGQTPPKKLLNQIRSRLTEQSLQLENIRSTLSKLILSNRVIESMRPSFVRLLKLESFLNQIHETIQNMLDRIEFDMIEMNLIISKSVFEQLEATRQKSNPLWEKLYQNTTSEELELLELLRFHEIPESVDAPAIIQDLFSRFSTLQLILQKTLHDHQAGKFQANTYGSTPSKPFQLDPAQIQ